MGLFDDIEVDWPLPDGYGGRNFQTKDLECYMEHYRITKEGALELRHNGSWVDEKFHGVLNFYNFDTADTPDWHEYNAKFTDGKLVEIALAKAAPTQ